MLTVFLTAFLSCSLLTFTPDRISEIIANLTPEEKAALIVGTRSQAFDGVGYTSLYVPGAAGTTHPIERLGIPAIVLADGPAGVRIQDRPCTRFPIGTLLASTWNTGLVQKVGEAMGNEALEYGVDVLLAPGANIQRNPLCGRNFEYYSEDPVLSGKIAAAMINGVQSQGVGTSLKHFAANNQELNRLYVDARIDSRTLREIYLRNFEIAVKEAKPWTIMTSYNRLNGIYTSENRWLLTDVLRGEWGFDGAVMTDWGGGNDAKAIVSAGNDMIQPGSDRRFNDLVSGMKDGSLPMKDVDACVERILKLIAKCPRGRGYAYSNKPDLKSHAAVAYEAACEGMVLLKNSSKTLPLDNTHKAAVFGVASYDFITGGTGSGDVYGSYVVDLKQGLLDRGYTLDSDVDAFYTAYMARERERCARINASFGGKWYVDAERPIDALPTDVIKSAAVNSDVAFITIGRVFGEGKDRSLQYSFNLSSQELDLIDAVSKAFHKVRKPVVVILDVGGIVKMLDWQDNVDAIIASWLPGEEAGHALADIISGAVCPSGHLPMTIPNEYEDDPTDEDFPQVLADKPFNYSFFGQKDAQACNVRNIDYTDYREGLFVGYRFYSTGLISAAYPFGFGLSYTRFLYSGLQVKGSAETGWTVKVQVKNTGDAAGKDVVQLYSQMSGLLKNRPARELKGFAKTPLLQPGESCTVEIYVPAGYLAVYDTKSDSWVLEKGKYEFIIAHDLISRKLNKTIKVR